LASKATGFPIALVSAMLATGLTLKDIPCGKYGTLDKYVPDGDYVVIKFARWAFEKFKGVEDKLGTQMRAVGEVMSIGKTYKEAFQKAIRSLETGRYGLGWVKNFHSLSKEELFQLIEKEMYVDETANGQSFHHKKLAEYLERAMYVCPYCGLAEFYSENDVITCKSCHRQIRYLPNQRLEGVGFEFPFPYVAQWYEYQNNFVNNLDTTAFIEKPAYQDAVNISEVELFSHKRPLEKNATIAIYGNRLQLGKLTLSFEDIRVITVLGKNKLNIYHNDGVYQVKGDKRFNGLKYMNIFWRSKNQQAGQGDFLGI
jgi:hypothetical protein